MTRDDDGAAADRVNAGEPIAPVEAFLIETAWELSNRLAPTKQHSVGFDLVAMAGNNPNLPALGPDQRLAFSLRYGLLDALLQRGILDSYMEEAELRRKVFAAAASLPCDKNDLGEAFFLKRLRESPPDVAEKMTEEARQAGYDPDHPKLDEKFTAWMSDNR